MSGLTGKTVIVTGSSSGIGQATAVLFASKGCNVTLCGRDLTRLQNAVDICKQAAAKSGHSGSKFISIQGDLTDSTVRDAVVEKTVEAFGCIDVVVSNHAVAVAKDNVENLTEEAFDTIFNTNLKSGLFLIKRALPFLEKRKGCVVCVSSIAQECCTKKGLFAYSGSKAAVEHLAQCMALDFGPKGIRVNCIRPTFVRTRIFRDMFTSPAQLDVFEKLYREGTPLAGPASTPDHPAQAIVFLASDEAKFISGASIVVDGGLMCRGNPPNFS
ncbi:glucose 1-dehydrogenase 3 [Plakobranchus ocellatus]|uniref:Glucose 1-dehydrogenase 3 n=1 Tax=Plakobranchus ocellatus TaxID=259542 RepID=A0AAV3ZF14_9GAST|nr:glucose 1-dehydrogenase 3 [Plakobranchus ocellatus]